MLCLLCHLTLTLLTTGSWQVSRLSSSSFREVPSFHFLPAIWPCEFFCIFFFPTFFHITKHECEAAFTTVNVCLLHQNNLYKPLEMSVTQKCGFFNIKIAILWPVFPTWAPVYSCLPFKYELLSVFIWGLSGYDAKAGLCSEICTKLINAMWPPCRTFEC